MLHGSSGSRRNAGGNFLVSLTNEGSLSGTVAALKTLHDSSSSWNKVAEGHIEKYRSHKLCRDNEIKTNAVLIRADEAVKKNRNIESSTVKRVIKWATLLDVVRQSFPLRKVMKQVMINSGSAQELAQASCSTQGLL